MFRNDIEVTLGGTVAFTTRVSNAEQLRKAMVPMRPTLAGSVTVVSAVHPMKAKLGNAVRDWERVTAVRAVQLLKAPLPMVVTLLGITSAVRPVSRTKAEAHTVRMPSGMV